MGPKGLIMGGKVEAQNGIDVFQIGSDRGAKAELVCGMDFSVLEKVVWSRDQNLSLIKQLKTLEAYKSTNPGQIRQLDTTCERIRDQIRRLSVLSRELVAQIDRNEDAAVVVRGTIYPGSYIEICHVSHVVSRAVSRVKYVLDKRRGVIRAEPL